MLNTVVSRFGTFGIGIVLARVLGPEAFGTFAVALVALLAVLSFNELGVSLAIVRWRGDPVLIASTVNTISVAGSTAFFAAAFLLAPAFTRVMGDPEATGVVRLLILSVVINGAAATPAALLQRHFRERTRMAIDQTNVWVGAAISVALALLGAGAMSLAVGRLAGSLISAVMFVRASPLPYRFGLDRTRVGGLLRFGLPLAGTSLIVFLVGYADQLTAGAVLGTSALAFYVMAFNLSGWPVSLFSQPLRRVAPAAFATLQDDPVHLRAALLAIIGALAAVTVPLVAFLAAAAVPLVDLVYGTAWVPAAAALSWLVASAVCRVFYELAYDYLVVLGLSGTVFWIQASSLLALVPALLLGARFGGIAGLAGAQAAVSALVLLPLYFWRLRLTGVSLLGILSCTWQPMLAGGAAWLSGTALVGAGLPPLVSLALGGLVSAALSAALLLRRWDTLRMLQAIGRSDASRGDVKESRPS
ncbi:oligosaccharide flippase family protein [Arthrobacter sp. N1]|uniref:oligosaccharide flippase family protein n=1 Tax=Arthrobacter sp. N1 TaxID=619291 RepID=UPI003BAEAA10